jgi:hypothetical protein
VTDEEQRPWLYGGKPLQAVLEGLTGLEDVGTLDDAVVTYIWEGSTAIARVVLLLNGASMGVGRVSLARPTLDDVFIRPAAPARSARPQVRLMASCRR